MIALRSLDIHICIWSELSNWSNFSCCIPPKNLIHSSYPLCRYFQGKKRSMNILKLLRIATSTFLKSSVLWGKIETEHVATLAASTFQFQNRWQYEKNTYIASLFCGISLYTRKLIYLIFLVSWYLLDFYFHRKRFSSALVNELESRRVFQVTFDENKWSSY